MRRIIIPDAPPNVNLDPCLRDDVDAAGISASRFRVLGGVLRWAGRRGAYADTVEVLGATCGVSESTARRELHALVADDWLRATPRTGRTTQYRPTERLNWGQGGLALFVPAQIDERGLEAGEFRLYYHLVRRAAADGLIADLNVSRAARACKTIRSRVLQRLEHLAAFGMLSQTAGHSYRLTAQTSWVPREQLPAIRAALTRGEVSPSDTPCLPVTPVVNPVVVDPVVNDDENSKTTTIFHEIVDGFDRFNAFVERTYGGTPAERYDRWTKTFGEPTIRRAWAIIRETQTSLDVDPRSSRYAKNLRLLRFLEGEFDGLEDPHRLCELYTQTVNPPRMSVAPPRPTEPPTPWTHLPRFVRERQEREARAQERAA